MRIGCALARLVQPVTSHLVLQPQEARQQPSGRSATTQRRQVAVSIRGLPSQPSSRSAFPCHAPNSMHSRPVGPARLSDVAADALLYRWRYPRCSWHSPLRYSWHQLPRYSQHQPPQYSWDLTPRYQLLQLPSGMPCAAPSVAADAHVLRHWHQYRWRQMPRYSWSQPPRYSWQQRHPLPPVTCLARDATNSMSTSGHCLLQHNPSAHAGRVARHPHSRLLQRHPPKHADWCAELTYGWNEHEAAAEFRAQRQDGGGDHIRT